MLYSFFQESQKRSSQRKRGQTERPEPESHLLLSNRQHAVTLSAIHATIHSNIFLPVGQHVWLDGRISQEGEEKRKMRVLEASPF